MFFIYSRHKNPVARPAEDTQEFAIMVIVWGASQKNFPFVHPHRVFKMNATSYTKIEVHAYLLKSLSCNHASVDSIANYTLFDEPYKLALRVLHCTETNDDYAAALLQINRETLRQVRRALGL